MTDLIGELRARRLVRELDPIRRPGAGRPTRPIAFDGEPWCVLGVQIDVDRIDVVASTVGGRALWTDHSQVDLRGTGAAGYASIAEVLRRQLERIPDEMHLVAMEIAVPGQVAIDRGTVRRADGLGWHDFALGTAVLETLSEAGIDQVSVGVSNVCQLAALYASRIELPVGQNGIAVYLGGNRRLGSGLVNRGEIFRGADGWGGDFAHLNREASGPICFCGRNGCLESLAGPSALLSRLSPMSIDEARDLVDDQPEKAIQLMTEAADSGEPAVSEVLEQVGYTLGGAIDDIIGAVNPNVVLLGGYLGLLSRHLLPSVQSRLGHRLAVTAYQPTEVRGLDSLNDRVVNGAILAARDACFYDPLAFTRPLG